MKNNRRRSARPARRAPSVLERIQILADTLVHHLLVHAPSTPVSWMRTDREVVVAKHAPHAQYFEAFGAVRIDEECRRVERQSG